MRRSANPPGYWWGEEFRDGFVDDETLPEGARRRIATWARAAGSATGEQVRILEHRADPNTVVISDAQREAQMLGNSWGGGRISPRRKEGMRQSEALSTEQVREMWKSLSREEQDLVLHPEERVPQRRPSYPAQEARKAGLYPCYPLNSEELELLTGASQEQIMRWNAQELLLSYAEEGSNETVFGTAGAIAAFTLKKEEGDEKTRA